MSTSKCVHTEHCCRVHGCKYGDQDCPVYLGYKAQSYAPECCQDWPLDINADPITINDVPKISVEEFQRRRNKAESFNSYDEF